MGYKKKSHRLTVKFINSDTDETLFEIMDRSWMNVGEVLSDVFVSRIIDDNLKDKVKPKNIMVLVVGQFESN